MDYYYNIINMESRLLKSLNNFLKLHVSGKLKNIEKKLSL
jgi:hypothetical protein